MHCYCYYYDNSANTSSCDCQAQGGMCPPSTRASVTSCTAACSGAHQSSPTFKVPTTGTYTVTISPSDQQSLNPSFTIYDDDAGTYISPPRLGNGFQVSLNAGTNYYIGDPVNATSPFRVCLS